MAADTKLFPAGAQSLNAESTPETQMSQFLIFKSDGLLFGTNVEYVMEIITSYMITSLPIVPKYVSGIINLRGHIIPILDIRLRLGRPPADESCIIVLTLGDTSLGILVDSVAQMISVSSESILPIPERNAQELVSGMCTLPDGKTMLILDCIQLAGLQ